MSNTRRYWDSSCFLGWLKGEEDKVEECRGVISAAENGDIKIVTSAFTLVEVLFLNRNNPIPKEDSEKVRAFFENDYILLVTLDRETAKVAQNLVWDYDVPYRDAPHIASALQVDVEIVETFDATLIQRFNNRIGTPPLRIRRPYFPLQLNLDDNNE